MENRVSKFEIVLNAVLFVLGCCGIGVSLANRVQKGAGELTMANYTDYMQVDCRLGYGSGNGVTIDFNYYIILTAADHYRLENVTIEYILTSGSASLPDGTITATIGAGESYTVEDSAEFSFSLDAGFPSLSIVVTAVNGTSRYTA